MFLAPAIAALTSTIGAGVSSVGSILGGSAAAGATAGGAAASGGSFLGATAATAGLGSMGVAAGAGATTAAATTGSILGGKLLTDVAIGSTVAGTGLGIANALNPPKFPSVPPPPTPSTPFIRGGSLFNIGAGSSNGTFFGSNLGVSPTGGKTLLGQ